MVEPSRGNGYIEGQVSFPNTNGDNVANSGDLELASPIFTHGPPVPTIEREVSVDIMEGVEQTSMSEIEKAHTGNSGKGLVRVLVPSLEERAEELDCFKESVRIEWLGTSTFFLAHNIELQEVVSLTMAYTRSTADK